MDLGEATRASLLTGEVGIQDGSCALMGRFRACDPATEAEDVHGVVLDPSARVVRVIINRIGW